MGDRVSTTFRFSGKLPVEHAEALRTLIDDNNPQNGTFDLSSTFEFEEVNYAQHDDLWDFARIHNLDWTMTWQQGGCFGPGGIIFRSGVEIECGFVGSEPAITQQNIEFMRLGDLDAVLHFLAQFNDIHNQLPPLEIVHA